MYAYYRALRQTKFPDTMRFDPTKEPKYDKMNTVQTKEDYHASSNGKRKKDEHR